VHPVEGTHVVLLGSDLTDARCKACLGFAIQRDDHTEAERDWVRGMKTYGGVDAGLGPARNISCCKHPSQTFL
jgi:hypothetical protein